MDRCRPHENPPPSGRIHPLNSTNDFAIALALLVVLSVGLVAWILVYSGGGSAEQTLDAIRTAGTIAIGIGGTITLLLAARRQMFLERSVEQEMAIALGLPPGPKRYSESEPKSAESSADPRGEDEQEQTPQPTDRANYAQHVEINVAGERASNEIADLVRQQSDGHARLVIKYYAQGHAQASISFFLSMTFAVVGFILIAIALVQVLQQPDQPVAAGATGFVGIVNEAVSFLFFRRADKGRDLMMRLIDKLRVDRESEMKFVAGLAAIEQVKSGGLQDALRAAAALAFTGSPLNLEHLAGLVTSGALDVETSPRTPTINVFGPQGHEAADGNGQKSADHDRKPAAG
jgi:hypothetical protein